MPFEYLDHSSEIGVLATSATVEGVFAESARGMFGIQVDREAVGPPAVPVKVSVEGADLEECLVEYLNALVAGQDLEGVLLTDAKPPRIERTEEGYAATGRARGVRLREAVDHVETEVKAVTYQGLYVKESDGGWSARFVVDI